VIEVEDISMEPLIYRHEENKSAMMTMSLNHEDHQELELEKQVLDSIETIPISASEIVKLQ
jgi:hypothetical protein